MSKSGVEKKKLDFKKLTDKSEKKYHYKIYYYDRIWFH